MTPSSVISLISLHLKRLRPLSSFYRLYLPFIYNNSKIPPSHYKWGYLYGVLVSWLEKGEEELLYEQSDSEWFSLKLSSKAIFTTRRALSLCSGLSLDEVDRGLKWLSSTGKVVVNARTNEKGLVTGLEIRLRESLVDDYYVAIPKPSGKLCSLSPQLRNLYFQSWFVLSMLIQAHLMSLVRVKPRSYVMPYKVEELASFPSHRMKQVLDYLVQQKLITPVHRVRLDKVKINWAELVQSSVFCSLLVDNLLRMLARVKGIFDSAKARRSTCVKSQWKVLERLLRRVSDLVNVNVCEEFTPVKFYIRGVTEFFLKLSYQIFPEAIIYGIRRIYGIAKHSHATDLTKVKSVDSVLESTLKEIEKSLIAYRSKTVENKPFYLVQTNTHPTSATHLPEKEPVEAVMGCGRAVHIDSSTKTFPTLNQLHSRKTSSEAKPTVPATHSTSEKPKLLRRRRKEPESRRPAVNREEIRKSLLRTIESNERRKVHSGFSKQVLELVQYWNSIEINGLHLRRSKPNSKAYRNNLAALRDVLNGKHSAFPGRKFTVEEIKEAMNKFAKKALHPEYPPYEPAKKHSLRQLSIADFIYHSQWKCSFLVQLLSENPYGQSSLYKNAPQDLVNQIKAEWVERVNEKRWKEFTPIQEEHFRLAAIKLERVFQRINKEIPAVGRIPRREWAEWLFDALEKFYYGSRDNMQKYIRSRTLLKDEIYMDALVRYLIWEGRFMKDEYQAVNWMVAEYLRQVFKRKKERSGDA